MIKGYIFGFIYIALVASSTIWLRSLGRDNLIPILLFYTSLSSIIIFNTVNFKNIKKNHRSIPQSMQNWVYMSVSLVLIWYFTYYSTTHSSAEFFIATAFLTTAFIAATFEKKFLKAFAGIISLSLTYFYSHHAAPIPFLTAMLAGVAGYTYYKTSYQFSKDTDMNVLAILSIRFYFVLIFAIIFIISSGNIAQLKITGTQAFIFLIFSMVNMIIPAFFSQSCLHSIGVVRFTFLNTLIPTLTFFLQALVNGVWNSGMLIACVCATMTLNMDNLSQVFPKYRKKQVPTVLQQPQ